MKSPVQEIKDFSSFVQDLQNNPEIAPLIDAAKIVLLPRFLIALDAAITHYLTHNDYTLITRIVELVPRAKQQPAVLAYVWERTNLSYSRDAAGVRFTKSERLEGARQKLQSLTEHLKIAKRSVPKRALPATIKLNDLSNKKSVKKRKYIDALDSWSRLPGSFEGGRSR
jgi:hypothetical protein